MADDDPKYMCKLDAICLYAIVWSKNAILTTSDLTLECDIHCHDSCQLAVLSVYKLHLEVSAISFIVIQLYFS